jgi:hypothetical protein
MSKLREPVVGSCENDNKPSIKGGEFLDWLSYYQFLNKDCAPKS